MITIVCQKTGEMKLVEKEVPAEIGINDVLVAVKRIGICGTDIHAFRGQQPFFEYPRILGHELSGVVEKIGPGVSAVKKGDQVSIIPYLHCGKCIACEKGKTNCCTDMKVIGVHTDGGMSEYIVVPEENICIVNQLTLDEAAIVEPLSIGAHAVNRTNLSEHETTLIIGAGPIGLGVAKFAKTQGARTFVMDISNDRLQFCKKWTNCDDVLLANEDALINLLDMNLGRLPTVVFDATGNRDSMMKAFDYVSHGGTLVYVGLVKDSISFIDPDFHSKELTLMGSRNATEKDFTYVIKCMEKGLIDATSYISDKINFDGTADYFKNQQFGTNKALIWI